MPGKAPRIAFNRNELAGSFGDIGTDLPLIIGLILAAGLDSGSVFVMFGLLQIMTGLLYGLPMPMQPLKAMAVLVITQNLAGSTLYGAGLAIGLTMLVLTLSGGLGLLVRWVPLCVVRGIQFGLGLKLASLALKDYIPAMDWPGYLLAAVAIAVTLVLWGNRRFPSALLIIGIGVVVAFATGVDLGYIASGIGFSLPIVAVPTVDDIVLGFFVLALPQLPLSVSNSLIATEQTIKDLFPEHKVSVRKLGLTYSLVNLVAPFFSGIPVCHGCGGLAGHHTFGARTGGSVLIYGAFFLTLGLFFSAPLQEVVKIFPLPILGVILLFESLTLLAFIRDQASSTRNLSIALLVGVVAMTVPQGFVVGLVLGMLIYYGFKRFGVSDDPSV